jgi:cytochrome c-type biogenesis protein CcmH/NrfF
MDWEIMLWFVWVVALLLLTLRGSSRLRKRSEQSNTRYSSQYQRAVSYWMLFIATGLVCMMVLVLYTIFS